VLAEQSLRGGLIAEKAGLGGVRPGTPD